MNKISLKFFIYFFVAICTPIIADNALEIRAGAFFPTSDRFTKIYKHAGPDFEIEFTRTNIFCSCLDAWANLNWFPNHGHVKHCGSSKIDIVNFSLGIKYSYCLRSCARLYAGIGPSFGWVGIENKFKCCKHCKKKKETDSKMAVGGVVKTGILYYFNCGVFLDLFADYNFEWARFHHTVDVGGFKTGLGVGFTF